jgi:hypothetical protein
VTAPTRGLSQEMRARTAAALDNAPRIYPGPVGELLVREIGAWAEWAHRLDKSSLGVRLVEAVEKKAKEMATERTYG